MSIGSLQEQVQRESAQRWRKDVDARYSYPNLYVAGRTKHANAFNCAQRSHQQQLETAAAFTLFALTTALSFPVVATVLSISYTVSRRIWAKGYGGNNDEGETLNGATVLSSQAFFGLLWPRWHSCHSWYVNLTGLFTFLVNK